MNPWLFAYVLLFVGFWVRYMTAGRLKDSELTLKNRAENAEHELHQAKAKVKELEEQQAKQDMYFKIGTEVATVDKPEFKRWKDA